MSSAARRPLTIIFIVAFVLVPSFVATVRSTMVCSATKITDIVVCEDLDSNLTPVGRASDSLKFPYGITQVCVVFAFQGRSYFETCVEWFHEGALIHSETVDLSGEGKRVFYLLRDDGAPLKKGLYRFSIICMGEQLANISFTVGEV